MKMTLKIMLIMFYLICNFFKRDDVTVLYIKYVSYTMVVICYPSFKIMITWY